MSDDEWVCPRCGETKVWGEEFAECEDCDPVGASDNGTGYPEPGNAALRAALATSQADVAALELDQATQAKERAIVIAALDTLNADVTRLAAELAESVRALAVSQGEVERIQCFNVKLKAAYEAALQLALALEGEVSSLRGDLERARSLLALAVAAGRSGIGHTGVKDCKHCTNLAECDAFLAPTASPEPEDPYCELAASEIPNFGTNRDTHRCAKAHRDKPGPAPK